MLRLPDVMPPFSHGGAIRDAAYYYDHYAARLRYRFDAIFTR